MSPVSLIQVVPKASSARRPHVLDETCWCGPVATKTRLRHHALRKCFHCGSLDNVSYSPDPFAKDVWNDLTNVWECGDCRYESGMDI